mmetsp:Transcript_59120/g.153604  ORF Transcript_59120/g.153604 Transcript_59120/m.153604 type:complete len:207 (+) Transcript_59120:1184-1804(+)
MAARMSCKRQRSELTLAGDRKPYSCGRPWISRGTKKGTPQWSMRSMHSRAASSHASAAGCTDSSLGKTGQRSGSQAAGIAGRCGTSLVSPRFSCSRLANRSSSGKVGSPSAPRLPSVPRKTCGDWRAREMYFLASASRLAMTADSLLASWPSGSAAAASACSARRRPASIASRAKRSRSGTRSAGRAPTRAASSERAAPKRVRCSA